MWVADMDFAVPDFVMDALKNRLEHPILGYTDKPADLTASFCAWLAHHFHWQVEPDWVVWLPAVMPGMNAACQMLEPGELLMPTPVYYPFLELADNANLTEVRVPMSCVDNVWGMDMDALQKATTADSRAIAISNPQNPTGRVFTPAELEALADYVLRNNLLLISDEIHANLVLDTQSSHVPVARHCPEVAAQTITLFAATKAYNIPGVSCAAAVIPAPHLREQFLTARRGLVSGIGPLGFAASLAAFKDRSDYLPQLRAYLADNYALIQQSLGARVAHLEGTYLAWIDVQDLQVADVEAHFVEHGVGLNPGEIYGLPGYVRLNFGCSQATLNEGLRRIAAALR